MSLTGVSFADFVNAIISGNCVLRFDVIPPNIYQSFNSENSKNITGNTFKTVFDTSTNKIVNEHVKHIDNGSNIINKPNQEPFPIRTCRLKELANIAHDYNSENDDDTSEDYIPKKHNIQKKNNNHIISCKMKSRSRPRYLTEIEINKLMKWFNKNNYPDTDTTRKYARKMQRPHNTVRGWFRRKRLEARETK